MVFIFHPRNIHSMRGFHIKIKYVDWQPMHWSKKYLFINNIDAHVLGRTSSFSFLSFFFSFHFCSSFLYVIILNHLFFVHLYIHTYMGYSISRHTIYSLFYLLFFVNVRAVGAHAKPNQIILYILCNM